MNIRYALTSRCMAIAILLTFLALSAWDMNASSESLRIQRQEERDWREIISLYEQGITEYQNEVRIKKKDHKRSESIFQEAADKLTIYINKFIKVTNSLKYLRVTFRLGTYWEHANKDAQALSSYMICANHPLINDTGSLFNNHPLAPLVRSRIKELQKRLNKSSSNNSQISGTRIIKRSSKGGSKGEGEKRNLPAPSKDLDP
jgi:hypothetical protein